MSNHRSRVDDRDPSPELRSLRELLRAKFDEQVARDSARRASEVDANAAIRTAAAHARVTEKALARITEQKDRP